MVKDVAFGFLVFEDGVDDFIDISDVDLAVTVYVTFQVFQGVIVIDITNDRRKLSPIGISLISPFTAHRHMQWRVIKYISRKHVHVAP